MLKLQRNTGIKKRAERNKKSSKSYQKKANMVRTKADAGGSSGSRKGIVFDNTSMHLYFCNSGQKIKKARTFNLLQGNWKGKVQLHECSCYDIIITNFAIQCHSNITHHCQLKLLQNIRGCIIELLKQFNFFGQINSLSFRNVILGGIFWQISQTMFESTVLINRIYFIREQL